MVPGLTQKALVLATTDRFKQTNLASIIRGCGYKGYPHSWWWGPLYSVLPCTGHSDLVALGMGVKIVPGG